MRAAVKMRAFSIARSSSGQWSILLWVTAGVSWHESEVAETPWLSGKICSRYNPYISNFSAIKYRHLFELEVILVSKLFLMQEVASVDIGSWNKKLNIKSIQAAHSSAPFVKPEGSYKGDYWLALQKEGSNASSLDRQGFVCEHWGLVWSPAYLVPFSLINYGERHLYALVHYICILMRLPLVAFCDSGVEIYLLLIYMNTALWTPHCDPGSGSLEAGVKDARSEKYLYAFPLSASSSLTLFLVHFLINVGCLGQMRRDFTKLYAMCPARPRMSSVQEACDFLWTPWSQWWHSNKTQQTWTTCPPKTQKWTRAALPVR